MGSCVVVARSGVWIVVLWLVGMSNVRPNMACMSISEMHLILIRCMPNHIQAQIRDFS